VSQPPEFVPLKSLKHARVDPEAVLAEIRQIYFKTTRQTIEHDLVHAVALLKQLESEEQREKATVYMHGLAEMRREFQVKGQRAKGKGEGKGKGNET
jgi:hypothetical protein